MMVGSVKLSILDALSDAPTYAECRRIAADLGTSVRYVHAIAELYAGWTPTPQVRKLPDLPALIAAIRGGKSASTLAREHECSTAAVYRALKRGGYVLRAGVITPIPAARAA